MIVIPPGILGEMVEQARREAPVEACGLLAGSGSAVSKRYVLTNLDRSAEHFSVDPREQLAAVLDARKQGLSLLALYHSHPATPARMSEEDLRLAHTPGILYVIVSLQDAERPEARSFRVVDGRPVEEPVIVEERS